MGERQQYAEVGEAIRTDILSGTFSFGQRLKIADLATRYGTSHMPIREALKLLSGEGLVEMQPNRGVRVRTVDSEFVTNLFDVRMAVESLQARLAAERRSTSDLAALRVARLAFEDAAHRGSVPELLAANREFHRTISEASGNREAGEIETRHWRMLPAIWTTRGYPLERLPIVIDDHRLLEELISARDGAGAAVLAASHCLRAKLHMMKTHFSRQPVAGDPQCSLGAAAYSMSSIEEH